MVEATQMRVDELAIVLEHLPPDAEIMVHSGHRLCHLGRIERDHGRKIVRLEASTGNPVWAHPGVKWDQPAPQVALMGRFRRAAELDQRLAAFETHPAPT
jgi:hypothetical protein